MRKTSKLIGIATVCFGVGILLTFFLPVTVLIIIEALVIVAAGVIFIKC